jgi:phage/plasmid-associated DNA primase
VKRDHSPRVVGLPAADRKPSFRTGSDVELAQSLVADLRRSHGEIAQAEGKLYVWSHTHFTEVTDAELHVRVQAYDGAWTGPEGNSRPLKLSSRQVGGVIAEARAIVTSPDYFAEASSGINCASGLIQFDANGYLHLQPHNPEHLQRHVLGASFRGGPTSVPPQGSLLDTLLQGCFRDDPEAAPKIALVGELAGAAAAGLIHQLQRPQATILLGERAENGKSQILDMLKGLLPVSAVENVTPAQMSKDQFRAKLAGKLFNFADELGTAAIASDVFKAVVTGEPVMGKTVYAPPFSFRPRAMHVFATNSLPTFAEGMDHGVRRRLCVLTFNRVIPQNERIVRIGERVAREEGDLLLAFAVAGAQRLLSQGAFTETRSGREALARWILLTDPVDAFLQDDEFATLTGDYQNMVTSREAYQAFRVWAEIEGIPTSRLPPHAQFTARIGERAPKEMSVRRRGSTGTMFHGLKLKLPRTAPPRHR